jgi:regulator of replication initiation timing
MSAGALVICICIVIFIIYHKKNIIKRVSALESIIDDLNHQSHKLNKTLKEINFEDDIKKIVNDKVEPLAKSIKEVKKITTEYRNQKSSSGIIGFEERVLSLYQDGKNESEIANILGASVQQVELILALNNPE